MYFFIINPQSRSGRGLKIWKVVEGELNKKQVSYESFLTEGIGDARNIAQSLTSNSKEETTIVILGGDGTLNEVLDGVCFHNKLALGYIPTGSGNDFARGLRLPKNPHTLLNHILKPKHYRFIDYGVISYGSAEVYNRRFAVSTGIGFDAAICHNILASNFKRILSRLHMGKLIYIFIGIKQLILAKPSDGYMVLDDYKKINFHNILFISSHIHKYEGGGFKFAPKADSDDGFFEICAVSNRPKRKLLVILFCALFGKHTRLKGVRIFRCREIKIHTDNPMAVHTDGESCGMQTDIVARCIEKKVKIIV